MGIMLPNSMISHGQRRPAGVPHVNWRHPLAQGLMVCLLDFGGRYIDVAGGYVVHPGLVSIPSVASPYGRATSWPGASADIGSYGFYINVGFEYSFQGGPISTDRESQITVIGALADRPAGAGFSFATACYLTDTGYNEQYLWGCPAHAQEQTPYVNWTLQARSASDGTGVGMAMFCNNNNTNFQVGSTNVPYSAFEYTSCCGTAINDTAGSATCRQYQQGVLKNSASSVQLITSNPFAGQDPESQLMIGSVYHEGTTQAFEICQGFVYYGYLWNRCLTAAEVMLLHHEPYCFLKWPQDLIFDQLVHVGGAAYTLAEDSGAFAMTGSDVSAPVARYMKQTAKLLGQA